MQLKRRVSLNEIQLDDLDDRIIISGIDEAAGKDTITAVSIASAPGQRITNMRRDTLDVTVKFKLAIKNSEMVARSWLLDEINAWARNGGFLRVGHRPGKRLLVTLAQAPGGGDIFTWTNEYSIVFRAYSLPYWEDDVDTVATSGTQKDGAMGLNVPGNTETRVSVYVENRSGKDINNVDVSVAGQLMSFRGLALRGGQTLSIDYEYNQRIFVNKCHIGSTGVNAARTAESVDEFKVSPGGVMVLWAAERAVRVSAYVRGRYL